ncbi:MAG: ribosome silencing factor [Piscinibacter sp.]
MDIRKLQRAIVDGLEDVKAQNIVVFNTEHLSPLFERVIVASGTSNRQTKALASSVRDAVKGKGFPLPRTEGEDNGEWIIVDCGSAVVHVMQPAIRDYYRLEEIWGGKPVKLKVDTAPAKLVKASEDAAPAKKAAAKKNAAPAKKAVAAKKSPAAKKAVPAKKAAPARKAPAAKKAAPVARKPAPAAKKATAKKAPAKRAARA